MSIKKIIDCINPFSSELKAASLEIKKWCLGARISVTALAILIGIPTLGLGGIIFFRWSATFFKKKESVSLQSLSPCVRLQNESPINGCIVEEEGPVEEVVGVGPSPKPSGTWQFLKDVFYESTERRCVEWKIRKYEGILLELKKIIKNHNLAAQSKIIAEMGKDLVGVCYTIEEDNRFFPKNIQNHLKSVRGAYEKFITSLRESLKKNPHDVSLCSLSAYFFTEIDLSKECAYTLRVFKDIKKVPQYGYPVGNTEIFSENLEKFPEEMQSLLTIIDNVPQEYKTPHFSRVWNSAKGAFNMGFDPYMQGNVPHVLYTLDINGKNVKALGMGTPTHEDSSRSVFLNEEFKALITSYKLAQKKHLFILNQDVTSGRKTTKKIAGNETPRSDLILDAQKKSDDAFFAVAFSKNSKFYRQENSKEVPTKEFKQELVDQFFKLDRHTSGCYIPENIKKMNFEGKSFKNYFLEIVNSLHENLFENKTSLSQQERKIFIETFYDTLIKALIVHLKVDSFNISCKDAIDRGAGSNAQLFANISLIKMGGLLQKIKNKIAELMNVRALFVRKRAAIEERCHRFAETLAYMIANIKAYQTFDSQFFGNRQVVALI